jgi:hypothetical protein
MSVETISTELLGELRKPPTVPPLPDGISFDVPQQQYHRRTLGHVSKGGLDHFHRSPAHYKAWVDGDMDDRDTPALSFGRAFHCAVLEPEKFAREYCAAPDFGDCRRKVNRERRDEWLSENAGKEALSVDVADAIVGMRESVLRHPLAGKMIRDGRAEVSISWKDPGTGLRCRARADYYVKRLAMVLDLKSADDASPEGFRRSVAKYRYFVQDALYRFGFSEVGEQLQHFVLIACEKVRPYAVGTYSLDAEGIGRGYSAARRDMDAMAECLRSNHWPAYPEKIQTIELPFWAD